MKEVRFFYTPVIDGELPEEEARHAVRVLRLKAGDTIYLMDGKGTYYEAEITTCTNHRCLYRILSEDPQEAAWSGHLHLALAPTKMMERVEWFAEKATEIGFDELSFLNCANSERRVVKCERVDKILVSAMKQSHKAWKPTLNEMQDFKAFVTAPREGLKLICHCHAEEDIVGCNVPTAPTHVILSEVEGSYASRMAPAGCVRSFDYAQDDMIEQTEKVNVSSRNQRPFIMDILKPGIPTTVLIGPEGDFSIEEVRLALENGYQSVSLGQSRLRTETAALVAVHCMQIKNQK